MIRAIITLAVLAIGAGISAIDMMIRRHTGRAKGAAWWIAPVVAWGVLTVGWLFILWQNNFHITTPVVMVSLAYLAVVATVYNLFRTGAAAVERNEEDDGDASWGLPIGARGELEREKKALVKAIKEAEFDQQMGKLSKTEAEQMIRSIRARAIEVIKELEQLDAGTAGTVRDRIEREVKARLEISAVVDKKAAAVERKKEDKAKKGKRGDAKTEKADVKADDKTEKADAKADDKTEKADEEAETADAKADKADAKAETADAKAEKADAKAETADAKAEHADDAKVEKADSKPDEKKADEKAETADAKAEKADAKPAANGDANHADKADAKTEGEAMPDPVASTSDAREARS